MAIARDNSPDRLVSASRAEEEQGFELKLRPRWLKEFIGQSKAKEQLAIALEAAKSRGEALDHVLLFGPPGLGKTTLATIIANELDVGFQQTSGPALQIQGDLTAILTNLRERQVLFLDEIHRMQPVLEEKLYTALEDYKLDIIIGQGPAARTHVMEIRPFTFIGATTRPGLLSSPLRSRFGILLRLEFYTEDELRVDRGALGRGAGGSDRSGWRGGDCASVARNSAHCESAAAARAGLCAGAGDGVDRPADGKRGADAAGSGCAWLRRDRPAADADDHRRNTMAGRSGWIRWPRRWPRKKMRWKKCMSRS